jgi:ribosomal peptide maturation radical SAM protein 1
MNARLRSDFSVILVSMPWATTARPSLSLSLLSSIICDHGYGCDVLYPNVFLSAMMGCNGYEYFANTPPFFGIAEHLFAVDIFGTGALSSDSYLAEAATRYKESSLTLDDALPRLRDRLIPDLLSAYAEDILRRKPDVVGFTCTFNQVIASVALAKRIKTLAPAVHIVFGGPCVHAEMGVCYSRLFSDCIDAVFLGEADALLTDYLDHLFDGRDTNALNGIARQGCHTPENRLFEDLDALPVPDYSRYFDFRDELVEEEFKLAPFHSLPFEASRGCWWGEKHHCTFCGLNNEGMHYRRRSVASIKNELLTLTERHGVRKFMATDNILDHRAYRELLPELAAIPTKLSLFFEIKTNISRADVESLAAAGVTWVQPGIESFSNHVLDLMRKGSTALQNIQALKWLSEFGIETSYNLLVGFPGETEKDYADLVRLIGKLQHLPPPGPEAHIVQVQRFAPFHFASAAFGIGPIRAARYYDYLIPENLANKEEYAYFFDRDIPPDAPLHRYLERVNACLQQWCSAGRRSFLQLEPGSVKLKIIENGTAVLQALDETSSHILVLSDEATGEAEILEQFSLSGMAAREDILRRFSQLEQDGLVVRDRGRILSIIPFENPQPEANLDEWLRLAGHRIARRSRRATRPVIPQSIVPLTTLNPWRSKTNSQA